MKLVYCESCRDIFNLMMKLKKCSCGKVSGQYVDNLNAVIYGKEFAVPLGFANPSFKYARLTQPVEGIGTEFTAFVIPQVCPTIEMLDK